MSTSSSRFVFLTLALVVALFMPVLLNAQAINGTILGTIQDQQGGAIGKAEISVKSLDTGAIRKATSADNGEYRVALIPAGNYEVTITAAGFKTEVRSGVGVTVGADVNLNFSLTVGAVTEKVEVTGEVAQVDTSGSAMGGFVNAGTIRELPLNGRDWLQLTLLQPGALNNAGTYQADTSRAQRGLGLQISISGGRVTENVYRIDGLVINDHTNSGPGSALHVNMGVDAIREFSVLTNNYSAEFGRGASGVVNAITKSGTNDYHGSLYYFHRNSAFDARNFFDKTDTAKGQPRLPAFRRHQYGGAVGGAIRKDKTFFFSNYEDLTEVKGLSFFSDTLSTNAHNGILCANTACTSTKTVAIDKRVQPYLQLYPFPNAAQTGDTGRFAFDAVRRGDERYVMGRIDHYFSSNTTLNGSYSYDNTAVTYPTVYDLKTGSAPSRKQTAVLSLQHIFSPTLINNTRFGVIRTRAANEIDCCGKYPIVSDPAFGFVPGMPVGTFAVTGLANQFGGIGEGGFNDFHYTAPQLYSDMTWTRGTHTLKFGAGIERVLSNIDERNRPNGRWTFPSIEAMLTAQPTQYSGLQPGSDTIRGSRNSLIGAYLQDDWRILPNLTLNLGVRYDMSTVIKEVNGKLANLRNVTDPKVTVGNPYYDNPTFKDFAPRLGFAWDPFKDGKTAVRGGVGMFDIVPLPYLLVNLFPRTTPFYREGTLDGTGPQLSPFFPSAAFSQLSAATLQATRIQPNPPRSYKMQWNFNVQRQLTRSVALTVGYVGSAGVKLAHTIYDHNQVPYELGKFNGRNWVLPIPPGNSTGNITRVNPNFGQIRTTEFAGHSSYHSLQMNLTQRLAKGLTYQVAYTWSKSIDNGTNTTSTGENLNTVGGPWAFCERCDRGPSDFDIPHNLVANFQYDIPVFAAVKSNKVANTILGGWQMGGILNIQTGGAYNLKITTDRAFTGNRVVGASQGGQRPDYLGDVAGCTPADVTTGNIDALFKASCFAFPAPGNLGNLGRDLFRMPLFRNVDFSVFKNQNLVGEKLKMQFRAEMFNILNNTNLVAQTFLNTFNGSGVLSSSFGTPTAPTVNQSRQIQFGLRLIF
jgi:carboxypeptidase family protein/TonB-dependent receptor-like protein